MFAHIFFLYNPELNKTDFFKRFTGASQHYEYWSVFFNSFMHPMAFAIFGYLLQRLVKLYVHDKDAQYPFNIIIGTLYFFAIFYFGITFFPYNNTYYRIGLDPVYYYLIAAIGSAFCMLMIIYLPKKVDYKKIIRRLFRFIVLEARSFIDPVKKKEYNKKVKNLVNDIGEQF